MEQMNLEWVEEIWDEGSSSNYIANSGSNRNYKGTLDQRSTSIITLLLTPNEAISPASLYYIVL